MDRPCLRFKISLKLICAIENVVNGLWATLLQLAQSNQLNIESARKVLKNALTLYAAIKKTEEGNQ